jgi:hypothetical protein
VTQFTTPITSSIAQTGMVAPEAASARNARAAAKAAEQNNQVRNVDERDTTVDTFDADARVFTDAEGSGSQGRNDEQATETPLPSTGEQAKGITTDADGQMHLDVQA